MSIANHYDNDNDDEDTHEHGDHNQMIMMVILMATSQDSIALYQPLATSSGGSQ